MKEDYTISGLVKDDCTAIVISKDLIDNLRTQFDDLDKTVNEYEKYISENGLPYLDYKIFRSKFYKLPPLLKFQNGIRRIARIVQSYKINDLQGFLKAHQKNLQEEKAKAADRRKGLSTLDKSETLLGVRPSGVEIKQMESIELKLNLMMDYIVKQSNQMDKMQKELRFLRNSTSKVIPEDLKESKMTPRDTSESVSHSSSSSSKHEYGKLFDKVSQNRKENKSTKSNRGISFDHVSRFSQSSAKKIADRSAFRKLSDLSHNVVDNKSVDLSPKESMRNMEKEEKDIKSFSNNSKN